LHDALSSGEVAIEAITGRGFGRDSVILRLLSSSEEDLEITVRQGTIFQHPGWQHRQNLLVCMEYVVMVPAGGLVVKPLSAYSMNSSCASPKGSRMTLTEFYFDDAKVLTSQGLVWDYFDGCFQK